MSRYSRMQAEMNATPEQQFEHTARRRAALKMGWYIHASVYILVNLFLMVLAEMSGRNWAVFPAWGWGIALMIHGTVVFFATGGLGLHERMVQRERERLAVQRNSW